MFRVDNETFLKIINSYGRNEKSFEEDVDKIHEWIKTQPHLPEMMDKKRIQNFLLLNKCRIETTKTSIDSYYTLRHAIPELYQDVDSKEMERLRNTIYFIQLPKLTEKWQRVHIIKLRKNASLEGVCPSEFVAHAIHIQEIRIKEDVIYEDIYIYDMEGFTVSFLMKLTPSLVYKMLKIYEKVASNRLAAFYIVHVNSYFDKVMALIKSFAKPKLFQRIEILKNEETLWHKLPKEILPKDLGGDEQPLEKLYEFQQLKLNEYRNYLKKLRNMKIDESLRPEKLKNDDLGFYGNFKKLEVD